MTNEDQKKEITPFKGADVPAEFDYGDTTGFEGIASDCFSFPFLRITQAGTKITPKVLGSFYNTVNFANYGSPLRVIFTGFTRTFVEWGLDKLGDFRANHSEAAFFQMEGLSVDEKKGGWLTPNGTRIVETRNFFAILPDHLEDGPILWASQGTGIRHSRNILSIVGNQYHNGKRLPIFAKIWRLGTAENSNDKGVFWNVGQEKKTLIEDAGFTPLELLPQAKSAYEFVKNIGTKFEVDGTVEEESPSDKF